MPYQQNWIIDQCILALMHTINYSYFVHTGSTIRNWHKVKAWLDQMFWQINQKLMLSGFLSSGNLCLIQMWKKKKHSSAVENSLCMIHSKYNARFLSWGNEIFATLPLQKQVWLKLWPVARYFWSFLYLYTVIQKQ